MILILSTVNDSSTDKVIDWIEKFEKPWIRINENEPILFTFELSNYGYNIELTCNGNHFNLNEIDYYWYRKGNFNIKWQLDKSLKSNPFIGQLIYNLQEEIKVAKDLLHYCLQDKKGISDYLFAQPNKLQTLINAQSVGLNIPFTIVSNNLSRKKLKQHTPLITKGLWEAIHFYKPKFGTLQAYTHQINQTDRELTSFPSLFQSEIAKQFEIRSFFLNGSFYSMAIFSQNDHKTAIDFRHYNDNKPNRYIPYNLPIEIEQKLTQLMTKLNLKTGSIDLILDQDSNYIFLEVNPVGQFGMVSSPCNYPIEKEIAKILCYANN